MFSALKLTIKRDVRAENSLGLGRGCGETLFSSSSFDEQLAQYVPGKNLIKSGNESHCCQRRLKLSPQHPSENPHPKEFQLSPFPSYQPRLAETPGAGNGAPGCAA